MGSSSRGDGKKRELDERTLTLRRRLHDALCLGIRSENKKDRKWQCSDIEIQAHALRQMSAFMGSLSSATLQHPLVKDSVSDMLVALEGTLRSDNERLSHQAAEVTMKLFSSLGSSMYNYLILGVVKSLFSLLSAYQLPVVKPCAITLMHILGKVGFMRRENQREVWQAIEKANVVGTVACALQNYMENARSLEYFSVMASLLEIILWRWPPSRYQVYSNSTLVLQLADCCVNSDSSVAVPTLKLYSAIALCGDGALKLLENQDVLTNIIRAMEPSRAADVRAEALKLCQNLTRSFNGCSLLTSLYCESIVEGIINAMGGWRSCSKNMPADQLPLVLEACRTALITRWAGNHHTFFWRFGIDRLLLDVLLGNCNILGQVQEPVSPEKLTPLMNENATEAVPFIWDVVGWLSVHCEENFKPKPKGKLCCLDILICCACSMANDLMHRGFRSLPPHKHDIEPVTRAVVLMLYSPCKYIASRVRCYLSEEVRPTDNVYLEKTLASLKLNSTGDVSLQSDSLQTVINLIGLTCYSAAIPDYQKLIHNNKGVQILSGIIGTCLQSDVHVSRSTISSHLHSISDGRTCCWDNTEDYEGGDIILFHSLQALSQMIKFPDFLCDHPQNTSRGNIVCMACQNSEAQSLADRLWNILVKSSSPGPRWYAEYILNSFGFYGFPSNLGIRMEKAVNEDVLADLYLVMNNGQRVGVHAIILAARCPSLLPPEKYPSQQIVFGHSLEKEKAIQQGAKNLRQEVRISDRVDYHALLKILQYVYTGYLQVDDALLEPLGILAKRLGLKDLYQMLQRVSPRWVAMTPNCDFSGVLNECTFWDVILEPKATTITVPNCSRCQLTTPHLHAHKIILSCSCDYLRAQIQCGMQDSYSKIINIPVGWIALVKLVYWFYTGKLPRISPTCAWNNLDLEQKLSELQAYVELSSLAEFWCLDEVLEESFDILDSCLSADQKLNLKVILIAVDLKQWKIVEAAVGKIAFLYPKMRESGDLEGLHEGVVELLRSEYVRHSQEDFG